jgi:hypothetical protein
MIEQRLAPIIIFAYKRPRHLHAVLTALSQCELADKSQVYCYIDGAKCPEDEAAIEQVVAVAGRQWGFKSLVVNQRESNVGLSHNILDGINYITQQHGEVIVLEDDIIVSPTFIIYMNEALQRYANDKRVWHISAATFPVEREFAQDTFFWRVAMGWGWATWRDRWQHFSKEPEKLLATWPQTQIEAFNLYGAYAFWEQVEKNLRGEINTWAVFWYATIFQQQGLCLSPVSSLTTNIGFDGSGTHTIGKNQFISASSQRKARKSLTFPDKVEEDAEVVGEIIRSNKILTTRKMQQIQRNVGDLKALLVKVSQANYFIDQYAGKRIALFGVGDISRTIHEFLLRADIPNRWFVVSDEHLDAHKQQPQIVSLTQLKDRPIDIIIVCIEGEHEQAMMANIQTTLPNCQIRSWRDL